MVEMAVILMLGLIQNKEMTITSNMGNVRVTDAGTTNQATYDDVIVTGYDTGLSIEDPPVRG